MKRMVGKMRTGLEQGLMVTRSGLPRSLRKYIGMPSGPGALWGHALDRADAISSIVIKGNEGFSAGYWKSEMSERSAGFKCGSRAPKGGERMYGKWCWRKETF